MVPNDNNAVKAIYLRDTETSTTTLVSVGSSGTPANADSRSPKVSDDGRFVVFVSSATNLVSNDTNGLDDIFIRDLVTGTTTRVSAALNGGNASGFSGEPVISATANTSPSAAPPTTSPFSPPSAPTTTTSTSGTASADRPNW